MALSSSPTTIFNLPKEDLSSILQILKPTTDEATAKSMSVCELRTHITEWLMLNDLSTMHDFKYLENSQQWKVPDRADQCISCGKYRVTSIGNNILKCMNPITEQPLTSRESLVFVGRETLHDRNGNKMVNKKKHGYDHGKDLCNKCAHWAFPNLNCFPNRQNDWSDVPTTVNSTSSNFLCFSCKS
ncbi:hypothetical protein DINM_002379 [Dirofilaria immitis]|nr:hypothetical protein [Dirofilaria immitis]